MAHAPPPSHGTTFLIVVIVLILAFGVVGFLPVLDCPLEPYVVYSGYGCPSCNDRGRITLLSRWRNGLPPKPIWEGKRLIWIEGKGFSPMTFRPALDHADIFGGLPLTNEKRVAAAKALLATGIYEKVAVLAGTQDGGASIQITVLERPGMGLH